MKKSQFVDIVAPVPPRQLNSCTQEKNTDSNILQSLSEFTHFEKWYKVCVNLNPMRLHQYDTLREMILRGVPDNLRGFVWQSLANCHSPHNLDEVYKKCSQKESPYDSHIERDIHRTFPSHVFFREKGSAGQSQLFNILHVLSLHFDDVGYCQGMGFIVGLILMHMDEESSFRMTVALFKNYKLRGLFKPVLSLLKKYIDILKKLLKYICHPVHEHLEREGVDFTAFASQWFLTLFTYNFPYSVVVRIWDVFFLEGIEIIFRVGVAILILEKDNIVRESFEQILNRLKATTKNFTNADKLIAKAMQIRIPERLRQAIKSVTTDASKDSLT